MEGGIWWKELGGGGAVIKGLVEAALLVVAEGGEHVFGSRGARRMAVCAHTPPGAPALTSCAPAAETVEGSCLRARGGGCEERGCGGCSVSVIRGGGGAVVGFGAKAGGMVFRMEAGAGASGGGGAAIAGSGGSGTAAS